MAAQISSPQTPASTPQNGGGSDAESLRKAHRKAARIALYVALAITAIGTFALNKVSELAVQRGGIDIDARQSWHLVDWERVPEVQLLQRYLRVDTNSRDGSELAGAQFLAEELRDMGLEPHIEQLGENNANLWAIIEGDRPQAVVLHSHIDVEPIFRPEEWTVEPFGGEIEVPWIYGRGAFDMKSVTVAQLEAVRRLVETGEKPRTSVILLATGTEETGSDLGARWFVRQHQDLLQRFEVVLTEGGLVEALDTGEGKYWGTAFAQRRFYTLMVCSDSRNELRWVRQYLRANKAVPGEARLTPEARIMLPHYGPTRSSPALRALLEDPERLVKDPVAFERLTPVLQALLRSEVYASPVRRSAEGGGFEMRVTLHLLPGEDLESARQRLVPDWLLHGLHWWLVDRPIADGGSPVDHRAFVEIDRVMSERYPEIPHGPFFLPWTGTDARFFRREGIPSYGFSPFLILTPATYSGANPNERISLPGYVEGVEIYADLLQRLVLED